MGLESSLSNYEKSGESLSFDIEKIKMEVRRYFRDTYTSQNSNIWAIKRNVKEKFGYICKKYGYEIMGNPLIIYTKFKPSKEDTCNECGAKKKKSYDAECRILEEPIGKKTLFTHQEENLFAYCHNCGNWEPRSR